MLPSSTFRTVLLAKLFLEVLNGTNADTQFGFEVVGIIWSMIAFLNQPMVWTEWGFSSACECIMLADGLGSGVVQSYLQGGGGS